MSKLQEVESEIKFTDVTGSKVTFKYKKENGSVVVITEQSVDDGQEVSTTIEDIKNNARRLELIVKQFSAYESLKTN